MVRIVIKIGEPIDAVNTEEFKKKAQAAPMDYHYLD
jgi:hypothetical protein